MGIKLKAKYRNNIRAKHLLKLVKMATSDEQTKENKAVKVFMLNLAAAGPVDLIPVPKDVSQEIADSMIEVMHLKSRLFEDLLKTGKKVLLYDFFDVPAKKIIKDVGPTTRLISSEAFAKALGGEVITDPKEIARLRRIRPAFLGGGTGRSDEAGCEDLSTLQYYDIAAARIHLGRLVSSVAASGKAVMVGKHGKPIVVIEPFEDYELGEGYVPELAIMIAEHLLGRKAPFHLRRPQAEEIAKLPLEKIAFLLKIDRMPIDPELRRQIVVELGDEVVISRFEKRYDLAESEVWTTEEAKFFKGASGY